METYKNTKGRSNRLGSGLILLVIGLIFFVRNFGIDVPHWIFRWHTILLGIGLLIGFRHNFTGGRWLIMVLIGAYFTLDDMIGLDFSQYYLAAGFIILGLYLILKPGGFKMKTEKKKTASFNIADNPGTFEGEGAEEDYLDSVNVFGGKNQHVLSKNFKGGDVTSIFGGCELNLSQADFKDTVSIDIVAIFGGVKIIIPPTWVVKSELTPIFGGIDDKRSIQPLGEGPHKTIKIKGVALFGGVDIRNY